MGAQAAVLILRYYLAFLRAFCCQFLNAALIPPLAKVTLALSLSFVNSITFSTLPVISGSRISPHRQADCIRYPFRCVLGCKALFYNPLERLQHFPTWQQAHNTPDSLSYSKFGRGQQDYKHIL